MRTLLVLLPLFAACLVPDAHGQVATDAQAGPTNMSEVTVTARLPEPIALEAFEDPSNETMIPEDRGGYTVYSFERRFWTDENGSGLVYQRRWYDQNKPNFINEPKINGPALVWRFR